ncbi:hypothetical protein ACWF9B_03620 [Streptomyces sp. NPDC055089]
MSQATTRSLRTVLQTAVGIAAALPALVESGALPRSLPWVGVALAVSGLLSRAMALPAVQTLLPAWLTTPADAAVAPADESADAPAGAVAPTGTAAPAAGPASTTTTATRAAHDAG